jgi:hypothetical protein
MRYAIVDTNTKALLTVVEYDTEPAVPPPGFEEGVIAVQHDTVGGDWTWDGTQLVAPPIVVIPAPQVTQVTPRQARLALYIYGLLDQVEALIETQGGTTKITWEYATVFDRNDPTIIALSAAITPPLSSEQLDELFTLAATL